MADIDRMHRWTTTRCPDALPPVESVLAGFVKCLRRSLARPITSSLRHRLHHDEAGPATMCGVARPMLRQPLPK